MIRLVCIAFIAACGTSTPPPPIDAGADAATPTDAAGDALEGASITWTCNGVAVADCTECGSRTNPPETHPCVDCSDAGLFGHCTVPGVSCGEVNGSLCPCGANQSPSACPVSYQVCAGSGCESCGDVFTDGQPCQGGGTCRADAGLCE